MASQHCPFLYLLHWLLFIPLLLFWPASTLMWWFLEGAMGDGWTRDTFTIPFEVLKGQLLEVAHGRWP